MRTKTKKILILLAFFLLIIILFTIGIPIPQWIKPTEAEILTLDSYYKGDKLYLDLYFRETNPKQGGCTGVSELQTEETYNSDSLKIDILGYRRTPRYGILLCPAMMKAAEKRIEINQDWFLIDSNQKQVIFNLNNQENIYQLSINKYEVNLIPVNIKNVKEREPMGEGVSFLQTYIFPIDVGDLFVSGSIKKQDYNSDLMQFANQQGFILADKKYPEMTKYQNDPMRIYVITKDEYLPEPPYMSKKIGYLGEKLEPTDNPYHIGTEINFGRAIPKR